MDDYEFKAILSELNLHEQASAFSATFWRWLRRPRREWLVNEMYPIVYVLG
jgi:hypothetical protein